jgi:protein-S-isoprenylcysteine O-methyltransferase Ste14
MVTGVLFFCGVFFIAYAVYTNYHKTDATKSVPMRVFSAVIAGFASIGAAIASWFTAPTPPTPAVPLG